MEEYRKILGVSQQELSDETLIRIVTKLKELAELNYDLITSLNIENMVPENDCNSPN